jgi:hypothetical protein
MFVGDTVAVNVTVCPATAGFGVEARVMLVEAWMSPPPPTPIGLAIPPPLTVIPTVD